jgi:hypothetical protein
VVQAGNVTSDLMFPGGSNLLLQPESAVKVFREYGVLEHGAAIQRGHHALVVNGLTVSSVSPQGAVFVDMQDRSHLRVAAQGGAAEVRNPNGSLVARLDPGKALSFPGFAAELNCYTFAAISRSSRANLYTFGTGRTTIRCATDAAWHSS